MKCMQETAHCNASTKRMSRTAGRNYVCYMLLRVLYVVTCAICCYVCYMLLRVLYVVTCAICCYVCYMLLRVLYMAT